MGAAMNSYSVSARAGNSSRLAGVLRRAPLVMTTVIFTLISFRYLAHPVRTAAEAGIAFTSPGGITIARVGFAAFPLSLAILAYTSRFSTRWRLADLYMVLTADSVVITVRVLGFWLDHSTATRPFF
jgi:predicted permease